MKTHGSSKREWRRLGAFVLSCSLLTGSILTAAGSSAMFTPRAEADSSFVYMNASNCYNITVHEGRNDAVKNFGVWGEELADGKGMKYTSAVNAGGDYTNYTAAAYDQTVNLDGLELTFSGLEEGRDGNPQPAHKDRFILYIGSGEQSKAENPQLCDQYNSGAISLVFDGATGTVTACAGPAASEVTAVVIKNASALRFNALKDKELTVRFNKTEQDNFRLTVAVGERKLTGIIPAGVFAASAGSYKITDTGSVYVGLTNGKNGWTSSNNAFDAYGINFIGLRENVPDDGSTGDDTIYMTKANYYYQSVVKVDEYWQHIHNGAVINGISCEELDGRGIRYQFATISTTELPGNTYGLYKQGAYGEVVNLNGLELRFSGFTAADANVDPSAAQKRMTLLLNSGHLTGNNLVDQLNGAVALVLDTESGSLTAYAGGHSAIANGKRVEAAVIENAEALKLENFENREFTIGFVEQRHDFKVTVTVGDQTVTGLLPDSVFALSAKYPNGIKTTDEVYVGLTNRRENNVQGEAGKANEYDAYTVDFISLREKVDLPPEPDDNDFLKTEDLFYPAGSNPAVKELIGGGLNYSFSSAGNGRNGYKNTVDLDSGVILQFDFLQADASETNTYFEVLLTREVVGNMGDRKHHGAITLRFDYVDGTVAAVVGGGQINGDPAKETVAEKTEQVISAVEALKLANLKGKPFTVSIRQSSNTEFEVAVAIDGGEPVKGYFSTALLEYTQQYDWSIKDISAVLVGLDNGEDGAYQDYSLDFVGITYTPNPADAVIERIDAIGDVTLDSEPAIEAAQAALNALTERQQKRVVNAETLDNARKSLEYLKQQAPTLVQETTEAIDQIGTVDRFSGEAIKAAEELFSRLSVAQKAQVKNAEELEQAIAAYYQVVASYMASDVEIYSPANDDSVRFRPDYWWPWPTMLNKEVGPNGGALYHWTNAVRDVRSGPGGKDVVSVTGDKFRLDGLIFQIANLTADENLTDETGVRLSIQIGNERNGYQDGKNLSLVLDTVCGGVRAYPGGSWLIQDEALKHRANGNPNYVFEIRKTADGLYRLYVTVDEKRLSALIPASALDRIVLDDRQNPSGLYVELSPWVNNEEGITDNSVHTFSAEFLSVQDTGRYAFEQANDIILLFNALPDKATADNMSSILAVYDRYQELPRALRVLVVNYEKMADLLAQIHEINAEEGLNWYDEADLPGRKPGGDSVNTGVTNTSTVFALASILAATVLLTLAGRKSKKSRHFKEGL